MSKSARSWVCIASPPALLAEARWFPNGQSNTCASKPRHMNHYLRRQLPRASSGLSSKGWQRRTLAGRVEKRREPPGKQPGGETGATASFSFCMCSLGGPCTWMINQTELVTTVRDYIEDPAFRLRTDIEVGLLKDLRHCLSALTMLLPANKAATMLVPEGSD